MKACPIVDVSNVVGGLYDPSEGRCDPHGTTHAYVGAAKKRGAEVMLHNRVLGMKLLPSGEWELQTEKCKIIAEHVVNAGGLWARKVGEMVGLNLPVTPMQHHYLITEDVPEITALGGVNMPSVTDLEGFTYLQQERGGVLLGIYEQNPKHWNINGAPWDYGQELIPEELDRITDELSIGLARFPALERVGIRKWVNGAFTFTPGTHSLTHSFIHSFTHSLIHRWQPYSRSCTWLKELLGCLWRYGWLLSRRRCRTIPR